MKGPILNFTFPLLQGGQGGGFIQLIIHNFHIFHVSLIRIPTVSQHLNILNILHTIWGRTLVRPKVPFQRRRWRLAKKKVFSVERLPIIWHLQPHELWPPGCMISDIHITVGNRGVMLENVRINHQPLRTVIFYRLWHCCWKTSGFPIGISKTPDKIIDSEIRCIWVFFLDSWWGPLSDDPTCMYIYIYTTGGVGWASK